jgi:tellurite resistance protein TerC
MLEGTIGYPPTTVALFCAVILGFLALDLYSHRKDKAVSIRDALIWSAIWIALALGFAGYLFLQYGSEKSSLFLTGYLLEKVLSVDNLMVFVAIFAAFGIPEQYRHRVLLYGVLGAIVFRLIFVSAGSWLYSLGPWVEFVFAAIIAWTAVKMLQDERAGEGGDAIADYSDHWSVRLTKRLFPVWPKLQGHSFFINAQEVAQLKAQPEHAAVQVPMGKWIYATPLFLCLIAIEVADIVFAFDSVPAVIAVTKDPLLVYTAIIFAILGLRQLYFVLAALQKYLVHLAKAIIILLFFIAFKLALAASIKMFDLPPEWKIEPNTSLMIVLSVLAMGVVASFLFPPKDEQAPKA